MKPLPPESLEPLINELRRMQKQGVYGFVFGALRNVVLEDGRETLPFTYTMGGHPTIVAGVLVELDNAVALYREDYFNQKPPPPMGEIPDGM